MNRILFLLLVCCWQMATAQPVTFTYHSDLLNPVSGFAGYADCAVDMNGDHLDDVVRIGNKGIYIDYQQPDHSFTQQFFSIPILSPPTWSICAGDIDNNGYNDLLFAGTGTNSFVKANENGSFYIETVMPNTIYSQRSTLADINTDGWLDAFVCHDTDQSMPYRNDGEGNMTPDTNLIHTANRPGNYAAIWTDYDNDGDIDLYITKCQAGAPPGAINRTNLLYQNNGDGTFSEVGALAGVDDNAQSWSTIFEDFDNDGDFDAFIVNHDFQNRLYRNNGDGTFSDVIGSSGIDPDFLGAWENASGDFNNDGYVDIFSEMERELYLGNGDLTFTGQNAPITPGAIADLNNDGFLDVIRSGRAWINDGNTNHWLKVVPFGITSNLNGIGARLEIYGPWGMQVREVRSGQSFSPMNSLAIHFGLGQNQQVDSLKIRWTSGIVTTLTNLAADNTYVVPETPCPLPSGILTIMGSTNLCPGDSTVLIAPNGFSNYVWSNNRTGQTLTVRSEGSFFAISTDSIGCVTLSQPVEIKMITDSAPVIHSPKGTVICEGDTLILSSSSGQNYTWSNGITGTQTIEVTESGSYTVAVDAICTAQQLLSAPLDIEMLPSPSPIADDVVILPGDSILLMAAGENCHWYDLPFGGNLLATGPTFQTMPLSTTSTYYVESHHLYPGAFQQGGKQYATGDGGLPSQVGYLLFEVWEPFTLLSVTVYVPPGAPLSIRIIQLWSGDSLLAVKQFEMQTGYNILDLDFNLQVGKFSLQCQQGNLWRNTGVLDYPYPIGDAGQITSSSFGENYYYYFYDWKIKKEDVECISARTPVHVIISGSEEIGEEKVLSMFPNPTAGLLWVDIKASTSGANLVSVFDAAGNEVLKIPLGNEYSFQLDLNHLPSGVYSLQISGDSFFDVRKLVKH